MTANANNVQSSRARQVGFLMRAYREAFVCENGRRGLTQEELLERMAAVSSEYGERYSHSTVSRWESGATRPTVGRLQVFGKAVDLTPAEIDGLMVLATLNAEPNVATRRAGDEQERGSPESQSNQTLNYKARWRSLAGGGSEPALHAGVVKFVLFKFVGLGAFIAGLGYALSLVGWNSDWMPAAYVFLVTLVVLAQGFLLPFRGSDLSEFFTVSLFVVLTTPILQFEPLDMDQYGFYRIGQFAGTHMPYMLVLLVNLALSTTAGTVSKLLWKWHYSGDPAESTIIRRAAWVNVPPVAFVYVFVLVISTSSVVMQLSLALAALASLFTVMTALRDPSINVSERDRQFLLSSTWTTGILFLVLGIIVVMVVYLSPGLPMVLPDHNLLGSWELDFAELGFTRAEALDRVKLGYLWHAVCMGVYMTFVVGGNMVVAMYHLRVTGSSDNDGNH